MSKSLRLQLELDVHAVSCPGVWFSRKDPVFLSVCFLGFHVRTKPFPPTFPFLFGDKFVFEKTFPGCSTLAQLESTLEHQALYVELLQENVADHHPPLVLATFETSGLQFLFPYPQLRPTYNSGVDVDLLMEPTRDFPGVISPKIEASTQCHINETRHAHLDQLHDSAVTINQVPPMSTHPHLSSSTAAERRRRRRSRSRSASIERREPFAWRKVDEDLIYRRPDGMGEPHQCDHGTARMRRSRSAVVWPRSDSSGNEDYEDQRRRRTRERRRPLTPPANLHRVFHDPPERPLPPTPPQPPQPPQLPQPPPPTPLWHHPPPEPVHPHPPPNPYCQAPYCACAYSCHVDGPPPSSAPHLHSKPRIHPRYHHYEHHHCQYQQPLQQRHHGIHHGPLPCYGPCCYAN